MAEQKFELRRVRNIGEIISDIFVFIRLESGPMLRSFFAISIGFILLNAIAGAYFQTGMMTGFFGTISGSLYQRHIDALFWGKYFIVLVSGTMTFTAMEVAVFGYIKAFLDNNHISPSIQDVWTIFTRVFLKMLVFNIPLYLMILVGMLFCFAPGIYLSVVFAPFGMIVLIEDRGFGDAFNRCFYIIRNNFWSALAVYLLAGLVYYIFALAVGGVISGSASVITYLTTKDLVSTFSVLSSFLNVFILCFTVIPFTGIALNYFTLVEKSDGTGILNRIDTIGTTNTNLENSDEEF